MRSVAMRFALPFMAVALPLAACGDADLPADEQPVGPSVSNEEATDGADNPAAPDVGGTGTGETVEAAAMVDEAATSAMPEAMLGRWALARADCKVTAASGLVTIEPGTLKFYESRAVIARVKRRGDDNIRALFDFVGEGQQWTLDMSWSLADEGEKLIRREWGEDASPQPLEYQKCE